MVAPSSTVITNLSRKAMSAITGLMLFTIKHANAIQTLLDMTAASASLATMAKTGHRKKTLSRREGSILIHQHVQLLHQQLCGDFDRIYMKRSTKPSWPTATQQHSFTTSATMTCSCGSTTMLHEAPFSHITWHGEILTLRMTCRGFLRGIDCIIQ